LLGAVALVLMIAAAMWRTSFSPRGLGRGREMAIRAALGAGRARLARMLFMESVLLSDGRGAAGLGLSVWGAALLRWGVPTSFIALGFGDFEPDLRVAMFATALSIATGFLLGFAPALQATRIRLGDALKESAVAVVVGYRHRVRAFLLVSQIALALVLLVASAF
jgi:hypothetical protein